MTKGSAQPRTPRLFINYRSADTGDAASALARELERQLEPGQVFIDHEQIRRGEEWRKRLLGEVERATVMFALIGASWLDQHDRFRRRLIDQEDDWVRFELERALERHAAGELLLVPIRVGGADIPDAEGLPEALVQLCGVQAARLRRHDHRADFAELLGILTENGLRRRAAEAQPGQVDGTPKPVPELQRYLRAIEGEHEKIRLVGFETAVRVNIDLEDLYIPLRAMPDLRSIGKAKFADATDAEACISTGAEREIPLTEAFTSASDLGNRRGLVILGDPGSGKTTHLERLLLWLVRRDPGDLGLPAGIVPVFLPLRELKSLDVGLDAFLERQLAGPPTAMPEGFGRRLLDRGKLLFLLDGLDEIPDLERRGEVARWIDAAANTRRSCRFVVTCRYAGYSDTVRLGADFLELHLRPLQTEQVEKFVRTWFRIVESSLELDKAKAQRLAEERSSELMTTLTSEAFNARRVRELTRNPLLLTAICLVHRDRGRLPQRRSELYEECVNVLLERWREAKKLDHTLRGQEARRVLQPLAHWLHGEEGRTRATTSELEPVLAKPLASLKSYDGTPADFLQTVRDESGLLTGWSDNSYGFMHLGFQEYLTARAIVGRAAAGPQSLKELAGRLGKSWWREVTLLVLATGELDVFERYMVELAKLPVFAEHQDLVAECIEDALQFSAGPFVDLLKEPADGKRSLWHRLKRMGRGGGRDLWRRQLAAYRILERQAPEEAHKLASRLRDHPFDELSSLVRGRERTRSSTTSDASSYELVWIPGGEFVMGSPEGEAERHDDEGPQHRVEVAGFYLGAAPVTNAEYARFLEAKPNVSNPEYWDDRRFNGEHQPVVGVSWKDAQAYCAWAGLRLPSEAEWEYACRAGTTTRFWSGDGEKDLAKVGWYAKNSGRKPRAVAEKPPNQFGLHDMHGNVWEWCEDTWHGNYVAAPVDGSAWLADGSGDRVIRGGSWLNAAGLCRSAYRNRFVPGLRSCILGFRPARS